MLEHTVLSNIKSFQLPYIEWGYEKNIKYTTVKRYFSTLSGNTDGWLSYTLSLCWTKSSDVVLRWRRTERESPVWGNPRGVFFRSLGLRRYDLSGLPFSYVSTSLYGLLGITKVDGLEGQESRVYTFTSSETLLGPCHRWVTLEGSLGLNLDGSTRRGFKNS